MLIAALACPGVPPNNKGVIPKKWMQGQSNNYSSRFVVSAERETETIGDLRNCKGTKSPNPLMADNNMLQAPMFIDEKVTTSTFKQYLEAQGKTKSTVKNLVGYARRFGYVLDTKDASPLLGLSPRNRHHSMLALANLAKFTGRYDKWLQIRQRYNLKWSKGDSMQVFQRLFSTEEQLITTFEAMLQRIKEMIRLLPVQMGQIIKFGTLVGLRSSEIIDSVRIINDNDAFPIYYNKERQCLEHFRFKKQFLRATKKCYISFVTPDILSLVQNMQQQKVPSWNVIRSACVRRGLKMEMRFCRKIFASYLSQQGIPDFMIDLLQGRSPSSVLQQHYLVPQQNLKDKVLEAISRLQKEIER